jgi:uncharacterized protein with PQ loop repeat
MIETIGYIATAITGISLMMENLKMLRLINAVGCLVWIIYGLMVDSMPVVITNVGIFGIHFSKLLKEEYKKNLTNDRN